MDYTGYSTVRHNSMSFTDSICWLVPISVRH